MKKVLVLGGAGYVGGNLVDELISRKYNVTVYDSLLYEDKFIKKVEFIYGDCRDYEKLQEMITRFDIIVALAAVVGDQACAQDPFLSRDINTNSIIWLANNFQGKLIFPSTCSVYGINGDLIDESAIPNPISVYAKTKLVAEQYILSNKCISNNPLCLRLGTLFGLSDQFARIRFDLVSNVLAMKAALGEKIILSGGSQWRPLLHVKDVANAIIHGIEKDVCGLFNLHESNMQIKDFDPLIRQLNPNIEVELKDIRFEDERNYRVSSTAYRSTGWKPIKTLTDGMTEIYNLVKEHRIKDVRDPMYYNVNHLQNIKTSDWYRV